MNDKKYKVLLLEINNIRNKWRKFAKANPVQIRKNQDRLLFSSDKESESIYKLHPEVK